MKSNLNPIFVVGLMAFGATAVAEDTLPLQAVNKANAVIDAAIEVYGGAEAISGLNSVAQKSHFITWAVDQSIKAEPPWDQNQQTSFSAVDFENDFFFNHTKGSGGGFDFNASTLIDGDNSFNAEFRSGTLTPIAEPDFNTTSGPFIRVTAPLLVKQLQERRQTSHWLGEVDYNGSKHDIITLVMEVGPALSLYFDQESHMLSRSERVLPPFGQVEYRFSDYAEIEGIPFAKTFELFVNGDPNLKIDRLSTRVNQPVSQYAKAPENLERTDPVAPDAMSLQEIDEGVFLVGGNGTYGMFVEMDDHVVAIGGTQGAPERIKELRAVIEDKPIRYGVLTHHHSDHVPGTSAYVAEGATVVTMKAHENVVRNAAGNAEDLKLAFVDGKKVLNGGARTIELHDIGPTPHAEHILVVWLPKEGILFEADHFPLPRNGTNPPAQPVTKALAKAIDERGFDVKMIVGAHSPRIGTRDDLAASLAKRPAAERPASP